MQYAQQTVFISPTGRAFPEAPIGCFRPFAALLPSSRRHPGCRKEPSMPNSRDSTRRGLQAARRCLSVRPEGGGDYGDVVYRSAGHINLVMADVAGHDAEAARIAETVRNTVLSHAVGHMTPAAVVKLMNRLLHREFERAGRFMTMLYAAYSPQTGILRYVNGGHHPFMLIRQDICRLLPTTNDMLLGVMETATFTEDSIRLRQGDVLVLYTDGILEARNARGHMFGIERLCRIARQCAATSTPHELLDAVYEAVLRHTGSLKRDDDQTLMVVKMENV